MRHFYTFSSKRLTFRGKFGAICQSTTLMKKTSGSFRSRSKCEHNLQRSSSLVLRYIERNQCCFRDCLNKATAVYSLCEFHRSKIADDFLTYYLVAGNLVDDLVRAGIRELPCIDSADTFIPRLRPFSGLLYLALVSRRGFG